jgi:hypothetical protein
MTLNIKFDTEELLEGLNINLPPLLIKILLPEVIPITVDLSFDFDAPYIVLEFPLDVGDFWGIKAGNITIDGTIQSEYLRLLYIINKIANIFRIDLIPPGLAKYLPVIDISELLTDQNISNVITVQEQEKVFRKPAFEVRNMAQVTVSAGSYNACGIDFIQGAGEIFYSPDVENIVKIKGNLDEFIPIFEKIELELISMKS